MHTLLLPEQLRARLRKPFGRVVRKLDAAGIAGSGGMVITVGDACSYEFSQQGFVPQLVIYDNREERRPVEEKIRRALASLPLKRVPVRNPPGTIQAAAWKAVEEGMKGGCKVEVDGEEDLLALPCIALAPEGSVVIYGLPGEGAVVVRVDEKTRKRAEGLLKEFKAAT